MLSERESLITGTEAESFPSPGDSNASSNNANPITGDGENESLLGPDVSRTSSGNWQWGLSSAARGGIVAARSYVIFVAACLHAGAAAIGRLFSKESNSGYSLPGAAATATATPWRAAFVLILMALIARLVLVGRNAPPPIFTPTNDVSVQIRYWAIMRVAGAAGSPSLTSAPPPPPPSIRLTPPLSPRQHRPAVLKSNAMVRGRHDRTRVIMRPSASAPHLRLPSHNRQQSLGNMHCDT
jgi:hypothetical protein